MATVHDPFWSGDTHALCERLRSSPDGLTTVEAQHRSRESGPNSIESQHKSGWWSSVWGQVRSPITLMLIFSAILSLFVGERTEAAIILGIIAISAGLGVWQELSASKIIEKLLAMVQTSVPVWRDGKAVEVPARDLVAGDVLELTAGASVPADCRLLEASNLFVNEATLTGETFPVDKVLGDLPVETALAQRTNSLFCGTHVESGAGRAMIARIGRETEFGGISQRLELRPPETEFERGVRQFGYFLMQVTLLLIGIIFIVNIAMHRPVLESFLFSLALAVGLTPQLLPAIISINLAHGARRMSDKNVVVKRLTSIENFGSMDVLCSDKTGTLTEGVIHVDGLLNVDGEPSDSVKLLATVNASLQSGYANPIDKAICEIHDCDLSAWSKVGELPYDFIRKRLGILADNGTRRVLISKGAFDHVLSVCSQVLLPNGSLQPLSDRLVNLNQRFRDLSEQGLRVLGIAQREQSSRDWSPGSAELTKSDETDMTFVGFIVLQDPPKADIARTVQQLKDLGVRLKMITGDNALVAASVAKHVGLSDAMLLTGPELEQLSDEALVQRVPSVDVFAHIEPNQKERIIIALKKAGCVVGYLGDGINDAPALHAADVGISVDTAVDVAREAADIVLLEHNLDVLKEGIHEGRVTFANTLKYVYMATSANFGNMFSMAGASLFLNFLPLLPSQILLMNLLTDFPEMAIASDGVDPEMIQQPRRWDVRSIRKFMIVFGSISSLFDVLTFCALLGFLHADEARFRTGWFLESVTSGALIVLAVRTRRPLWGSRPSNGLLLATLFVIVTTLLIPLVPFSSRLGFAVLPGSFFLTLIGVLATYLGTVELTKRWFYSQAASR
jgi:Mg2+-importing ATPase